jgi:hypothetical protein
MIEIFIPSYKRPSNVRTAKYLVKLGYDSKKIHVFLDSEAQDIDDYNYEMKNLGCHVHVFDMKEARDRYDYVHRAPKSRRSAGQARNMFYDFAKSENISFYIVIDDDTSAYQIRPFGVYTRLAVLDDILKVYEGVKSFMIKKKYRCIWIKSNRRYVR